MHLIKDKGTQLVSYVKFTPKKKKVSYAKDKIDKIEVKL